MERTHFSSLWFTSERKHKRVFIFSPKSRATVFQIFGLNPVFNSVTSPTLEEVQSCLDLLEDVVTSLDDSDYESDVSDVLEPLGKQFEIELVRKY